MGPAVEDPKIQDQHRQHEQVEQEPEKYQSEPRSRITIDDLQRTIAFVKYRLGCVRQSTILNRQSSLLVRSSPLAAFPLLPDTECLQLLIEVSLTHGLFDLRAVQARAQPVRGIGDGKCNCGGFGHMFLQLRQV